MLAFRRLVPVHVSNTICNAKSPLLFPLFTTTSLSCASPSSTSPHFLHLHIIILQTTNKTLHHIFFFTINQQTQGFTFPHSHLFKTQHNNNNNNNMDSNRHFTNPYTYSNLFNLEVYISIMLFTSFPFEFVFYFVVTFFIPVVWIEFAATQGFGDFKFGIMTIINVLWFLYCQLFWFICCSR